MALLSLLCRPSPRLPLAVALLSRLSPPPSPPLHNSYLFSTYPSLPPPAKSQQDKISRLFRSFVRSPWAIDQALSLYLPPYAFSYAVHKFRSHFLSRYSPQTADRLLEMSDTLSESSLHRLIMMMFTKFYMKEMPDDMATNKKLLKIADMSKPHLLYPSARLKKRKIIYHYGPTNSGKTYAALNRFAEVERGVYCSPLRLLATEVANKMNKRGVSCSLLTGQEMNIIPCAGHMACTIEMTSFSHIYDVAILDEIQMMADPTRGYHWTRALLGLISEEIHLCGDASALQLVQEICGETGDLFEKCRYERFRPLRVDLETFRDDLTKVRSGDCVIAFSQRDIYRVKSSIELFTKHKCCLVYGNMPPEIRQHQANLFNEKNNCYDILVASDAVGMGLNLEIRRVIFYTMSKFNGKKHVRLESSQVKQIAGRAGRRSSIYPQGLVTTVSESDMNYLVECLEKPICPIKKAGVFPSVEKLEHFATYMPKVQFAALLKRFMESAQVGDTYFVCEYSSQLKIGNAIQHIQGLSMNERIKLTYAPIEKRNQMAMFYLLRFTSCYSEKTVTHVPMEMSTGLGSEAKIGALEAQYQVLMLYIWFSRQFEETYFPDAKRAKKMAAEVANLLKRTLMDFVHSESKKTF